MADKDVVIASIRAVLISRKDPATLYQLGRDYKELEGTIIPYKQFGFSSLEGFIRSDSTFRLYRSGTETFVAIEPKKESKHLTDMVAKQKSNKKHIRSVMPRALRSGFDRNSKWAAKPTYTRNPVRTSKGAQLYIRPSQQISINYSRLNGIANKSSVQQRLENIAPNAQQSYNRVAQQSSRNFVPPSTRSAAQQTFNRVIPPIRPAAPQPIRPVLPPQPIRPVLLPQIIRPAPTPVPNIVKQPVRTPAPPPTVAPQPVVNTVPIRNTAPVLQNKPIVDNSNSKLTTNGNTSSGRTLSHYQGPEAPAVRFELPPSEEAKKDLPSNTNSKGAIVKTQYIPQNKLVNHTGAEMTKRSIIDLEAVQSTNSRTVNVIPPTKKSEYGNIQVTTLNNITTNYNNYARPVGTVRASAQDRLSRIRQDQPPEPPNLEPPRLPKPKISQQSRLQKYRPQEVIPEPEPACPQKINVVTTSASPDTENTSDKNLVNEQLFTEFCNLKNLAIQEIKAYKHTVPHNLRTKNEGSVRFGCTIKVGGKYTYGSYSETFTSTEEAVDAAARDALDALTKIYGSLEERNLPITEGTLVPPRLLKIIAGYTNGKFLHQLPGEYREEYHENLPEDWLKFVEDSHLFHIEGSVGGSQIIFVKPSPNFTDKFLKTNHEDFMEPTAITLPEQEGFWNVLVTHVCSTVEVWARILGEKYNGLYENLTTQMEIDHMNKEVPTVTPQIGGYYLLSTEECWIRAQILEIKKNEALCFYIDSGEEHWHEYTNIHKLDKKYRYVPPQGVLMQLSGLQEYAENKYAVKHLLELLLDKPLVAEIVRSECDGTVISAVLFDTHTDEDINLNAELLIKIKEDAKAPTLKKKGVNQVYVSHVSDNGDVFIQVRNDSFKYLITQIQIVADGGFGDDQVNDSKFISNSSEMLYLMVNKEENKCYRVMVTGPIVADKVPVFFVDYGYSAVTEVSNLNAIHKLSSALDDYPHQALKVQMKGMTTFTPAMAARIRGCLPVNAPVLLKVIEAGTVPVVELFMRSQNDLLISVNNALQNEIEIEKNAEEVVRRPVTRQIESVPIMRNECLNTPLPPSPENKKLTPTALPEPKIPCDGSFFQVIVTMAASPANFVIQPYKEENILKNMMSDLQSLCNNSPSPSPAHSGIKKGNIYAGKHSDGNWYRIQVTNVMSNKSVSVHFCDYGDYNVMSSRNLQRLTEPFLKIPYHAVRARLADIATHDWSVTDCLTFQQLVCEKVFNSVLRSIDTDELNPSEKILNIILIDSENGEDRYITPELIKLNH